MPGRLRGRCRNNAAGEEIPAPTAKRPPTAARFCSDSIRMHRCVFRMKIRRFRRCTVSIWMSRARTERRNCCIATISHGRWTLPAEGKRIDTCGFYPLDSSFPYFLVWRRSETGDRSEKRGTTEDFSYTADGPTGPSFLFPISSSDSVLLHIRFNQRSVRHKVNCP